MRSVMHLLYYLCVAKENFAAFLFFPPKPIKLDSTKSQKNTIPSAADSQLPNCFPSEKRHDWIGLLPSEEAGFHHTGELGSCESSEPSSPALSLATVVGLQLLFSPLPPPPPPTPGVAQYRSGNHELACLCATSGSSSSKIPSVIRTD